MSNVSVNLNTQVTIKLTAFGADAYNKYMDYLNLPTKYRKPVKANDTLDIPLWEFAQIFGSEMYMGNTKQPLFTSNSISFNTKDLNESPTEQSQRNLKSKM